MVQVFYSLAEILFVYIGYMPYVAQQGIRQTGYLYPCAAATAAADM